MSDKVGSDTRFFIGCGVFVAVLVGVCILVSGGNEDEPSGPEQPGFEQYITSVCDEHGNRLYSSGVSGSLAVVGQDPTCKEK